MKKRAYLGSAAAVLAGVTGCLALTAQVASCGGDDSQGNGGPDASEASVADGTTTQEGSAMADSPVGEDADAGGQVRDADAGTIPDGAERADGADGATCSITVPSADEFFSTLATTVCQSLKSCCGTGARFDTANCLSIYGKAAFGGFLGVGFTVPYLDGGRIDYDPSAACQCLEGVLTVNCGLIPQETLASLQNTCVQAVHGTAQPMTAIDGGEAGTAACAASYECAAGSFCTTNYPSDPLDAALGSCQPLVVDGGACGSDLQCSYLGNGAPSLYCSGGKCTPRLGAGDTCTLNSNCASNVCASSTGNTSICATGEISAPNLPVHSLLCQTRGTAVELPCTVPVPMTEHYQISTQVHARRFDDEMVVLHLGVGKYFSLDAVGSTIWEQLTSGRTPAETVVRLLTEYEIDEETACADVKRLTEELLAAGLLERRST